MNWIKLEDKKPNIGEEVILSGDEYVSTGVFHFHLGDTKNNTKSGYAWLFDPPGRHIKPTHWMPLPSPPLNPGDQYEIPFPEDEHLQNF